MSADYNINNKVSASFRYRSTIVDPLEEDSAE
jgi:hypothetical protein